MAKQKTVKPANRRGSPEAIEKRRAGRLFNDVLGGAEARPQLDGRTEKRRQRLLKELETGKTSRQADLKPLDVLLHVQELLELGEPLASIRKVAKVRKVSADEAQMVDVVTKLHRAYAFRPEVYRFAGIGEDVLKNAGVVPNGAEKRLKRPRVPARKSAA